jgi:pyruvate kinase
MTPIVSATPALLKRRRTRLVATVGPASRDEAVLEEMVRAGVDVFRLNLSHGDHATHRTAYERIRAAQALVGEPVAVMADLCGPKIRVGRFQDGSIELTAGEAVTVTTREVGGRPGLIPSQYPALHQDVRPGDRIPRHRRRQRPQAEQHQDRPPPPTTSPCVHRRSPLGDPVRACLP